MPSSIHGETVRRGGNGQCEIGHTIPKLRCMDVSSLMALQVMRLAQEQLLENCEPIAGIQRQLHQRLLAGIDLDRPAIRRRYGLLIVYDKR